VVGDGASIYSIQALWTAGRYDVGTLFVVFVNGGYAIMDRLAERTGQSGPWPALDDVDLSAMARAQGVEAIRLTGHAELLEQLDVVLPTLAERTTPLVLEIVVEQDATFDP
jgi:benzoylformate decarboxylase